MAVEEKAKRGRERTAEGTKARSANRNVGTRDAQTGLTGLRHPLVLIFRSGGSQGVETVAVHQGPKNALPGGASFPSSAYGIDMASSVYD
jgi:hypothetical protein